ncbi:DUF3891 family protein [Bacillus aerolatus]|uniref:DUF3891 family protein n=1 Tax=Bacillus aerolatus TaxID=2653354 RepID=A0A6I1FGU0_9BACI|nr:DUF3891 family protein [Bacillus aerolatus]KAB7707476.1 DUF3891 family protein [Bacillus aerolatus]
MIVRERENEFIMIEQDHHAQVSGSIMTHWKDSLFIGKEFRNSVQYAISMHDCGWKPFDKEPFWNDTKQKPYTFLDFPVLAKIVLYKNGIDEVEKNDPYAALLCSMYYTGFLKNEAANEAKVFVAQEKERQEKLIHSLEITDRLLLHFHCGLLQFGDHLSLYICLNEPGAKKEEELPFFRDGIPLSSALHTFRQDKLQLHWRNKNTIAIEAFPFENQVAVTLKQKVIQKDTTASKGLLESYKEAPLNEMVLYLVDEKNKE